MGHELVEENLYWNRGNRWRRICLADRARAHNTKRSFERREENRTIVCTCYHLSDGRLGYSSSCTAHYTL